MQNWDFWGIVIAIAGLIFNALTDKQKLCMQRWLIFRLGGFIGKVIWYTVKYVAIAVYWLLPFGLFLYVLHVEAIPTAQEMAIFTVLMVYYGIELFKYSDYYFHKRSVERRIEMLEQSLKVLESSLDHQNKSNHHFEKRVSERFVAFDAMLKQLEVYHSGKKVGHSD